MNNELEQHYNHVSQLHTPFIPNEQGSVFAVEPVHRPYQTSNIIQDKPELYEYSQPQSIITFSTNQVININNPFNTPAQVSILYASIYDATAYFALTVDNKLPSNFFPSGTDFTPCFSMYGKSTYTGTTYWIDFQNYVNMIIADTGATGINIIVGFRRLRDQFIPRNVNMLNELVN